MSQRTFESVPEYEVWEAEVNEEFIGSIVGISYKPFQVYPDGTLDELCYGLDEIVPIKRLGVLKCSIDKGK